MLGNGRPQAMTCSSQTFPDMFLSSSQPSCFDYHMALHGRPKRALFLPLSRTRLREKKLSSVWQASVNDSTEPSAEPSAELLICSMVGVHIKSVRPRRRCFSWPSSFCMYVCRHLSLLNSIRLRGRRDIYICICRFVFLFLFATIGLPDNQGWLDASCLTQSSQRVTPRRYPHPPRTVQWCTTFHSIC